MNEERRDHASRQPKPKPNIMCILITKEKGINFPTVRNIINCVESNPNGFAMAYNEDGAIVTFKTLDADEFIDEYKRVTKTHDAHDTAMIIHARIATHGTVKESNCHCWTGKVLGSPMAFAHNGILRIAPDGDMTDSETFFRHYVTECRDMRQFLNAVNRFIGTSKFAFLDGFGNILRFGPFIEERGVQYSNRSYMRHNARCADPRLWGSYAM